MRPVSKALAAGAACAALAAGVLAHVRLINPSNGAPLFWGAPSNVSIVISSAGSDDLPDGSHETSLRMAIEAWNEADGSSARLVEDTSPASQARTDWESTGLHLIYFDEDDSSGYFPGSSGTVAITPVWFFSNGLIADADVLFNGDDFRFTTSAEIFRFDVQDVGTHELGHLLGLDHSGVAGSTMYPFVDPSVILHRSLSADDVHGMRDAYPQAAFGQLTGTVERQSDASPVAGAHVAARDASGRTVGATITSSAGTFVLRGLDPGTYTVYAAPLDEPVSAANLSTGHVIEADFQPAVYGSSATIVAAETVALGVLQVGAEVSLNLGRSSDLYPLRVVDGTTQSLTVRGTGLLPGSTLSAADPDFVLGPPTWVGSQVTFSLTVPDGEEPGHVDLTVVDPSGDTSILSGGLEVTPPAPTIASTTPSLGSQAGGNAVTITGTGFNPGARVVIGDQIYRDGDPGVSVVDAGTITLTTAATVAGVHDVVVIDATGVEGRQSDGFQAAAIPAVSTVFPAGGSDAGGTEVVVTGGGFQPGVTVRIDGVTQSDVTFESESRLRFTTAGGAAGGPYVLEVENPDAGLTSAAFTYAAQDDPAPTSLDPPVGSTAGGDTVMVTGANFTASSQVLFGVDPDTGLGGTAAASVTFIDAGHLEVVTPSHGGGVVSVMIHEPSSGQAGVVASGFTFGSSGGGGGGCASVVPVGGPRGPAAWAGAWWIAFLFAAATVLRYRRPATARAL